MSNKIDPNTFCTLPFTHKYTDVSGNNYLCCYSSIRIDDISSGACDELRKRIAEGQRIPHCQGCYNLEDRGIVSPRQKKMSFLKNDRINDFLASWKIGDPPQILTYDLRYDNTCNLACVMCGPKSSSLWEKQMNITPIKRESPLDVKSMMSAEQIYLAGGEPFLIEGFKEVIREIANCEQQPELVINTNLSVIDEDLFECIKHIQDITLVISVDAVGKVGEYHRWPLNWEKFLRNFDRVCELIPQQGLMFNTVIDAVSVFGIGGLIEFQDRISQWNLRILDFPESLVLNNVPRKLTNTALDQLSQLRGSNFFSDNPAFQTAITQAQTELIDQHDPADLIKYINQLDAQRKINHIEFLGVNFNE